MKVTNLRRKIAAALTAAGIAVPAVASGAPLNTNLIANPSFEDVDTNVGGAFGSVLINQWEGNGFAYAYSQNYDNGGPLAGGGDYYFNGGNGDGGNPISQNIDVSADETGDAIAAGTAGYDLSAYFSSYLTQGDFGNVTAIFLAADDSELGSVTISDTDTTQWSLEAASGPVPAGTATVRIESQGTALSGAPDGYVDLVSFSIAEVPEPSTVVLIGMGLAGLAVMAAGRRS